MKTYAKFLLLSCSLKGWGIIASFGGLSKGIVNRSPSYRSRLLLLILWDVIFLKGQDDIFSVSWPNRLQGHLCHAGCHARYIRNTFLFAPSTTSLLVTTMGAFIYHNYIFSCFFVCLFVLFSLVVVLFSLDKSKKCRKVLENFWKHPSCVIISLSELPAVLAIENYFLIYRFSQG